MTSTWCSDSGRARTAPSFPKLFLVVLCVVLSGMLPACAPMQTLKKTVNWIHHSKPTCIKKIGMLGMANRTYFQTKAMNAYAKSLGERFTQLLGKDPEIKVLDPVTMAALMSSSPLSATTGSLMEMGRKWGLNAVLGGNISEMTYRLRKFGIYGFREERPTLRLLIQVRMVDVETGTVLYQGEKEKEWKIDPKYKGLVEYLRERSAPPVEVLDDTLEDLADEILDVLHDQPWKSFVTKVSGKEIEIGSGREVGLEPGQLLDLWKSNPPITNNLGQMFRPPGEKTGRIRIERCERHFCVARPEGDVRVHVGDMVTLAE